MVEDSCDRCEKYNEDCLACRSERAFQTIVNRKNLPPKDDDVDRLKAEDKMRREHARLIADEQNLHPEDAGEPRTKGIVGATLQNLPPSKRFPQGANRTVRIYGQGVPMGQDETGATQLRPTFAGIPFATDERQMKNPAANIFRRGNPMNISWRLLKDGDR